MTRFRTVFLLATWATTAVRLHHALDRERVLLARCRNLRSQRDTLEGLYVGAQRAVQAFAEAHRKAKAERDWARDLAVALEQEHSAFVEAVNAALSPAYFDGITVDRPAFPHSGLCWAHDEAVAFLDENPQTGALHPVWAYQHGDGGTA